MSQSTYIIMGNLPNISKNNSHIIWSRGTQARASMSLHLI